MWLGTTHIKIKLYVNMDKSVAKCTYTYTCIYECSMNMKNQRVTIKLLILFGRAYCTFSYPQHGFGNSYKFCTYLIILKINYFFLQAYSVFYLFLWFIRTCILVYVRLIYSPELKAKLFHVFHQHTIFFSIKVNKFMVYDNKLVK